MKKLGCILGLVMAGLLIVGILTLPTSGEWRRATQHSAAPVVQSPPLELQSWSTHAEAGDLVTVGEVKNVSSQPLERVQAVVAYYDKAGAIVGTENHFLDLTPLAPGALSSFHVRTRVRPEIANAKLSFKLYGGDELAYRQK